MNEHDFEMAVVKILEEVGWNYLPPEEQPERDYRNPLFVERLEASVLALPCNAALAREDVYDALRKIAEIDAGSLVERNRVFTDYLQNGVPVVHHGWAKHADGVLEPEERTVRVFLVDFTRPEANDFTVANQWTVEGRAIKRPDVVLFVNGLPLVVLELKSPSREETDENDAYRQLVTYRELIPELFVYNAFLVTGDKAYRRELAARFKDDRSELKIAIVVDMWLTGFDVPSLATMYV